MIEQINRMSEIWWNWMWPMFWQVSVLIVVITLIDLVLRKYVWPQVRYALWLLVLVKLLLPPSFALPTGVVSHIRPLVERSVQQPMARDISLPLHMEQTGGSEMVESPAPIETSITTANTAQPRLSWHAITMIGWMVTMLLLMLRLLGRHRMLWRIHYRKGCSRDLPRWLPQLLDNTAEKLHLRQTPQVVFSSTVNCPAVLGIFRPVLLLPARSIERLSQQEVEHILLHELAHVKRRDLPVHALCVLLQIFYWFNPLLILVRRQLQRLRELCCDATVAGILRDKTGAYSQTILRTVEWLVNGPRYHGIGLLGLIEDPHHLRVRLEWLKRKPSRHPSLRIATAFILVATMFAFILPMATAQTSGANTKPATLENTDRSTQSLHEAAAAGNIERARMLIAQGMDVNAKDEKGRMPLHCAAKEGHKQMTEWLLANGADIEARNQALATPLNVAVGHVQPDVAELLIAKGANVMAKDKWNYTPLHACGWDKSPGIVRIAALLIDKGADVNAKTTWDGTPLTDAADGGNVALAKLLIDKGAEVNAACIHGCTTLWHAASSGHRDIVELMVSNGADVNRKDKSGRTPILAAMRSSASGQKEVVEFLMSHGVEIPPVYAAAYLGDIEGVKASLKDGMDINIQGNGFGTLLHIAAAGDQKDVAALLIAKGADIDVKDNQGGTAFHNAVQNGCTEVAGLLIDRGADVNKKDWAANRPLHVAVARKQKAMVELLIAKGADIEAPAGRYGNPPLVSACAQGHRDIAGLLLSKGANIEARNNVGTTPLLQAAYSGQTEVAELLLSKGAKLTTRSYINETALHTAIKRGHRDVVELLLKHGADIRATARGWTPAVMAMRAGQDEQVRFLIEKGANHSPVHVAAYFGDIEKVKSYVAGGGGLDARNPTGQTLLHIAVCADQVKVVKFLLDKGTDVNLQDNFGWSTLHWACAKGRLQIVKDLLARGADLDIRDSKGRIPTLLAAGGNHHDITRLTLDRGADVNSKDHQHYTPLHGACYHGDVELIGMLLARGADVNARIEVNAGPRDGFTPLHMACSRGHVEAVRLLLANGVDINAETYYDGKTGLDFALERGFLELAEVLREHGAKE